MDATKVIDLMVKNFEPIMEPEDLKIIKDHYVEYKDSFQEYLDTFYPPEEQVEEKADAFVNNLKKDFDDEMKKRMRDAYIRNYNGELTMAKLLGVSEESLNTTYTLAYNSYNQGNYQEAKNYFDVLIFLDHNDPSFRFGKAASFHMMKDYPSAINQYIACLCGNFTDPIPWYHLADCCIALKNWKLAMISLNAVIEYAKGDKDFKNIVKKCQLMKDAVKREQDKLKVSTSAKK